MLESIVLMICCMTVTVQTSYDTWQLEQIETAGTVWNSWDTSAIAGLATSGWKWSGAAFVSIAGKLYFGPEQANGLLVVDPTTNASDTTAIAGFGRGLSKWLDVIYVHDWVLVYCGGNNQSMDTCIGYI